MCAPTPTQGAEIFVPLYQGPKNLYERREKRGTKVGTKTVLSLYRGWEFLFQAVDSAYSSGIQSGKRSEIDMKRIVIGLLLAAMLLISATAAAERYLHEVYEQEGAEAGAYEYTPGTLYATVADLGVNRIEARILVRNLESQPVTFEGSTIIACTDGRIEVVDRCIVEPDSVPPEGYALLTFSDELTLPLRADTKYYANIKTAYATDAPVYIGVGDAYLEKSKYDDSLFMRRPLDDLPLGLYTVILVAMTDDRDFLWAEDTTQNTKDSILMSQGIEYYEVQLFRKAGLEPTDVDIVVYQR